MKKIFVALLVVCVFVTLISCGESQTESNNVEDFLAVYDDTTLPVIDQTEEVDPQKQYYGTWDFVCINVEGVSYSVEELETMGDYSLSDFKIVVKEGGKAYVYSDGYGELVDWETTDNGIIIGVVESKLDENLLSMEKNGTILFLAKTSDSQTIVINQNKENLPVIDQTEKVDPQKQYYGTWGPVRINIEGVSYSVEELEAMGDYSLSDFKIVVKEGGKAYVYSDGHGGLADWETTDNGIIIGAVESKLDENLLSMETDGIILFLVKTSDSQTIVNNQNKENDCDIAETTSNIDEIESVDETTDITSNIKIRPEFKEAMDAYEAFYDEYCEFMKQYKENPYDFSLLAKYTEMMKKTVEINESFEEWDEEEMNNAEIKYYLEVNNRVMQKLIDVAG